MLCKVCEAKSLPVDIEMCPAKYTIPDGHLIQTEGKNNRDPSRFFDQVGHQTTNASIGTKHFFTK